MNVRLPRLRIAPLAAAFVILILGSSVGCATHSVSVPEPTDWSDSEVLRLADELSDQNVEIIASSSWSAAELETIAAALESLPAILLPTTDEPLRLARVEQPCLFGIGRYNTTCPTFADDGTFFLFEPVFLQNSTLGSDLEALTKEERLSLVRKRAVTHALMVRADKRHKWSETHHWRQINGWDRSGSRAQNRNPDGFLRPQGQRSAHLDLVTSAESFFFRTEDIALNRDSPPDGFDPDMSFTCQEFTRQRILANFFDALDPGWRSGTSRDLSLPRPTCESFETWADLENIEGIDILFAAERMDRPESLFGHLLLHIQHDSTDFFRGEGFEYVYQFGAVASDVDPITYLVEGFTGGFLTIFDLSTFRGIDHTYLQLEQRTLRRYSLRLNEGQTRRLMERIWEVERRFAYPYYFTTRNCASMILDLLNPVLEREKPLPRRTIAMPTDILDILAQLEADDGGSLLRKRPDDVLSAEERAIRAVQHQRRIIDNIDANSNSELVARLRELPDLDPAARAETYSRLGPLLVQNLKNGSSHHEVETNSTASGNDSVDYRELLLLADSFVEIERANLERARAEVLELRHRALLENQEMSPREVFEFRRELFSHEDLSRRARERNEFAQMRYELFRDGQRRDPTRRKIRASEWESILSNAFDAATDVQATLVDAVREEVPSFDAVTASQARNTTHREHQLELNKRSLKPSNSGRLRLAIQPPLSPHFSALGDPDPSVVPLFSLHLAVIEDHLGQRRLHGHRPEIEAVGFAARLRAPMDQNALQNLDLDITLLRYISLATPRGGEGRRIVDSLGWGGEVELRVRHHELPVSGRAFFGVFYPIFLSPSGVDHLAIGLGPLLASDITTSEQIFSGGIQPYLLVRKHLAGTLANVAFLRLRHFEGLNFNFETHRQTHLRGGFEFFVPAGRHGLLLSPFVEGELHQYLDEPNVDDRRLWAGFLFEPLRNARP